MSSAYGWSMSTNEIQNYYALGQEQHRLSGDSEVERLRTEVILDRYLPPAPAVICDVGGGAGIYAFPLARKGYQVHLIDIVPLHIEQAKAQSLSDGIQLASITLGDARNLAIPSSSADAVLLLGPLYHLAERTGRMKALREAHRILKPGATLIAAAISRFASFVDGLSHGMFKDAIFRQIVSADLASGMHKNPTDLAEYFTTAYLHHPDELKDEVSAAHFENTKLLAIEGPAWGGAQFRSAVVDVVQRKVLLEMLAQIEEDPSIMGASAHFLAIARKPIS